MSRSKREMENTFKIVRRMIGNKMNIHAAGDSRGRNTSKYLTVLNYNFEEAHNRTNI